MSSAARPNAPPAVQIQSQLAQCAQLPRLDRDVTDQIVEMEAMRPGLLQHLIGVFQRNFEDPVRQLDQTLQSELDAGSRATLHSLKGAAASLGAVRLSATAALGESLLANGDAKGLLGDVVAAIHREFAEFIAALTEVADGARGDLQR